MNMVSRVQELTMGFEGRLQLQLIGGYSDPHNYSEDLYYNILREFIMLRTKLLEVRRWFASWGSWESRFSNVTYSQDK